MIDLTAEDLATLKANLAEARAAYHQIQIGRQSVEVSVDGYMVRYNRTTLPELRAYIGRLEAMIAGRPVTGAVGVIF